MIVLDGTFSMHDTVQLLLLIFMLLADISETTLFLRLNLTVSKFLSIIFEIPLFSIFWDKL